MASPRHTRSERLLPSVQDRRSNLPSKPPHRLFRGHHAWHSVREAHVSPTCATSWPRPLDHHLHEDAIATTLSPHRYLAVDVDVRIEISHATLLFVAERSTSTRPFDEWSNTTMAKHVQLRHRCFPKTWSSPHVPWNWSKRGWE